MTGPQIQTKSSLYYDPTSPVAQRNSAVPSLKSICATILAREVILAKQRWLPRVCALPDPLLQHVTTAIADAPQPFAFQVLFPVLFLFLFLFSFLFLVFLFIFFQFHIFKNGCN